MPHCGMKSIPLQAMEALWWRRELAKAVSEFKGTNASSVLIVFFSTNSRVRNRISSFVLQEGGLSVWLIRVSKLEDFEKCQFLSSRGNKQLKRIKKYVFDQKKMKKKLILNRIYPVVNQIVPKE